MKGVLALVGPALVPLLELLWGLLLTGAIFAFARNLADKRRGTRDSIFSAWPIVLLLLWILTDLPMTRTEYSMCIENTVQQLGDKYESVDTMRNLSAERNATICDDARVAMKGRQTCLERARGGHVLSNIMSIAFDATRGMNQSEKTDELLKKRSCLKNIRGALRTNAVADTISTSIFAAGVLATVLFCAYSLKTATDRGAYIATGALLALPHVLYSPLDDEVDAGVRCWTWVVASAGAVLAYRQRAAKKEKHKWP